MEVSHPYEETPPPLPKCFFKYEANKVKELSKAVVNFGEAIDQFGVFEIDNPPFAKRIVSTLESFEEKVKNKTGLEVFVVVLNYVNEETFLAFASIGPYFESESQDETMELTNLYFPEGAVDELPLELMDPFEFINEADEYEDEEEEGEDDEDEDEDKNENVDAIALFD